ncbi:hypothetical protein Bbelb_185800 [Branchiostoma belcheri]|nr:hypothetical protein Bbelb_185800 [Branchiostoma belcheri]
MISCSPEEDYNVELTSGVVSVTKEHASIVKPLRDLTRQSTPLTWGKEQNEAFDAVKAALSHEKNLSYFDADTILTQKEGNGTRGVITYASRSLSDVRFRAAERAGVHPTDLLCRIHRAREDSGQNEAERHLWWVLHTCAVAELKLRIDDSPAPSGFTKALVEPLERWRQKSHHSHQQGRVKFKDLVDFVKREEQITSNDMFEDMTAKRSPATRYHFRNQAKSSSLAVTTSPKDLDCKFCEKKNHDMTECRALAKKSHPTVLHREVKTAAVDATIDGLKKLKETPGPNFRGLDAFLEKNATVANIQYTAADMDLEAVSKFREEDAVKEGPELVKDAMEAATKHPPPFVLKRQTAGPGEFQRRTAGPGEFQRRTAGPGEFQRRTAGPGEFQRRTAGPGEFQRRTAGPGEFQRQTAGPEGEITHHGETVTTEEAVTPSLENFIVLLWLKLLHPALPALVKQRYGSELRHKTLASIKTEISLALLSLMDELQTTEDVRTLRRNRAQFGTASGIATCYTCGDPSHFARDCPVSKEARPTGASSFFTSTGGKAGQQATFIVAGQVEGKKVPLFLDTGSTQSLIRGDLVDVGKIAEDHGGITCVHGEEKMYPTAQVEIRVGNRSYRVNTNLPRPAIVGRDVPHLAKLVQLCAAGKLERYGVKKGWVTSDWREASANRGQALRRYGNGYDRGITRPRSNNYMYVGGRPKLQLAGRTKPIGSPHLPAPGKSQWRIFGGANPMNTAARKHVIEVGGWRQPYRFVVTHRAGKANANADALSRA